jgi:hypothetical protein
MYFYCAIILISELTWSYRPKFFSSVNLLVQVTWIVSSFPQAFSLINPAISQSGAGRALVTNDQYQACGIIYAKSLSNNTTDVSCMYRSPK